MKLKRHNEEINPNFAFEAMFCESRSACLEIGCTSWTLYGLIGNSLFKTLSREVRFLKSFKDIRFGQWNQ